MSLASNAKSICNDVFECLSFNGVKIKKECIHITTNASDELFIKAISDEPIPRQFSMKLQDEFIVCDDSKNIKFNITPFKGTFEFSKLSKEELEEKREDYYNYLLEIGEISESELQENVGKKA